MTLSVQTRFEIFKRDRFTCQYCGKHPPDVLLEADHIVPRAAGGSDDLSNLTTACTDCNRGKGSRLLEEGTAPTVNASALAELQERIDQAKAYMDVLGGLESLVDDQVQRVIDRWAQVFGAETEERDDGTFWTFTGYRYQYGGRWPDKRSIRQFVKKLTLEQVLDAVDIAASRMDKADSHAVRYFYGICHRSIREGREPLSPQTDISFDQVAAARAGGIAGGRLDENLRLRDIFVNHEAHGFETYADVVAALWPDDD